MSEVGLSTLVTVVVLSMAFSEWVHALLNLVLRAPILWIAEKTWLRFAWRVTKIDQATLERNSEQLLRHVVDMREERDRASRGDRWRKLNKNLRKKDVKRKLEEPGDEQNAAERGEGRRNGRYR